MAVTPRTFFQPFAAAVFNGVHNFATDTLKIALTNVEPVSTYANLSSISQIATGGGYSTGGFAITTTASTQSAGVYKLILQDYTFSATGTVAEWQYAVLYNDTAAGDPLIGWYTFAVPFNLTSGDTFPFDFDGSNGALNFVPGGASSGSVTVAVAPGSVAEDGTDNLVFTFTRTGITASSLTVNYAIGGTAINGTDYAAIGTTASFAIGSATTTVTVNPTTDATIESDETVILTVAPGSGYIVGSPSSATGTIEDDDAVTDPEFPNVSVLLPLDGPNGSTTITDESNNSLAVTALSNAAISTAQSKFGGASCAFDGSFDCLSVASSTVLDLPGDFTIEFFAYLNFGGNFGLISRPNGSNINPLRIDTSSGALRLFASSNGTSHDLTQSGLGTPTTGTWQHIALTRSGSTWRMFIEGTQTGTFTSSLTPFTSTDPLIIGARSTTANSLDGFIDEVRITKGVARYTSGFTPPTAAFPTS